MTQREKDARRAAEAFRQPQQQEELELIPPDPKKKEDKLGYESKKGDE